MHLQTVLYSCVYSYSTRASSQMSALSVRLLPIPLICHCSRLISFSISRRYGFVTFEAVEVADKVIHLEVRTRIHTRFLHRASLCCHSRTTVASASAATCSFIVAPSPLLQIQFHVPSFHSLDWPQERRIRSGASGRGGDKSLEPRLPSRLHVLRIFDSD